MKMYIRTKDPAPLKEKYMVVLRIAVSVDEFMGV